MKVTVKAIVIALIRRSQLKREKEDTKRRKNTMESEKNLILVTAVIAIKKGEEVRSTIKVKERRKK